MMADQEKTTCSSSDKPSTDSVNSADSPGQFQLNQIRQEIDRVDENISSLISVRLELVRKIADIKGQYGIPTLDGNREKKVLERVLGNASNSASAHAISTIYEALLRLSKEYQRGRRTDNVDELLEKAARSTDQSQDDDQMSPAFLFFPNIAIIGLGAIGGSMAAQIRRHLPQTKIIACEPVAESGKLAKEQNVVDELIDDSVLALKGASLILLCASPETNLKLLKKIAPHLQEGQLVMDVTSTKAEICHLAEELDLHGGEFIGGHPFFGTERSGFEAASDVRAEHRIFCVVPTEKSSPALVRTLTKWLTALNLQAEILDAKNHDILVARASHIPQLLSSMLGSQLQRNLDKDQLGQFALANFTTFQSLKRLMKSPSPMWKEIIGQNQKEIVQGLTEFQEVLDELLKGLKQDDMSVIDRQFAESAQAAQEIEGSST